MDNSEARAWLLAGWEAALQVANKIPDPDVDQVVNSRLLSIRYAVFTQLLGKIANPKRGVLCCQSETGEPGAWDARSFCSAVIVPWVAENHDVLGKSPDPYVNNPLRRPVLTRDMPRTRKMDSSEWAALFDFLAPLDTAPRAIQEQAFQRCLQSAARRLAQQTFQYPIPKRVSLERTQAALETFLAVQSNGLRPMTVATALMRVVGEGFQLFHRVDSQGVTEADAASAAAGDVMCYDEGGNVVLAVEVKDRNITLSDVRSSTRKARLRDQALENFLFAAPGAQQSEMVEIEGSVREAWASGLNLYRIDLLELATSCFMLLDEGWRPKFLREVGIDLDRRADHLHRRAWYDLLSNITGEDTS